MRCTCCTNSQGNAYAFVAISTRLLKLSPALLSVTCCTWKEALARAVGTAEPPTPPFVQIWLTGKSSTVICTCCVRRSVGNGCAFPAPVGMLCGSLRTTAPVASDVRDGTVPVVVKLPPSVRMSFAAVRLGCDRRAFCKTWSPVRKN